MENFDWQKEREKHSGLINELQKDRNKEDFIETMTNIFCRRFNLTEDEAMKEWNKYKDEFIKEFK